MADEERQRELIMQLSDIAAELDWLIAIPVTEDNITTGVIMGTQDFLIEILGDRIDEYDIMAIDEMKLTPPEGMH